MPLRSDPTLFRKQVLARRLDKTASGDSKRPTWVVIDEVQRFPAILNEVHDIMTEYPDEYLFALTGSNARKLRRQGVNLLAGRALERSFFPFTRAELGSDFSLDRALDVGTMPLIVTKPEISRELLISYVGMYLREEIQQEALVDDIGSFNRFLPIAALLNGTTPNVSNVAREAGVARKTVERYFEILIDTLVAYRLPAWQPNKKVKESSRPKFYFFDCGVVRAITNRLGIPATAAEQGLLLETYILHEIRAHLNHRGSLGELFYWSTKGDAEVDIVWQYGSRTIGFEIKSATTWHSKSSSALKNLLRDGAITEAIGLYRGSKQLEDSKVRVLPVEVFLEQMTKGLIFN